MFVWGFFFKVFLENLIGVTGSSPAKVPVWRVREAKKTSFLILSTIQIGLTRELCPWSPCPANSSSCMVNVPASPTCCSSSAAPMTAACPTGGLGIWGLYPALLWAASGSAHLCQESLMSCWHFCVCTPGLPPCPEADLQVVSPPSWRQGTRPGSREGPLWCRNIW